jgi:hypothetical protein
VKQGRGSWRREGDLPEDQVADVEPCAVYLRHHEWDFCHSDDGNYAHAILMCQPFHVFGVWIRGKKGKTYRDPVIRIPTTPIFVRAGSVSGQRSQIGKSNITTSVPAFRAASARNACPIATQVPGTL